MMTFLIVIYCLVHIFSLYFFSYFQAEDNLLDNQDSNWKRGLIVIGTTLGAGILAIFLAIFGIGVLIRDLYIKYRNNRREPNETRFKNSCMEYLD